MSFSRRNLVALTVLTVCIFVLATGSSCPAFASTFASCETLGIVSTASSPTTASCSPSPESGGYSRFEEAAARAAYGNLGVKGKSSISSSGAGVSSGFMSVADFSDTYIVTGTSVTDGYISFELSAVGTLLESGTGYSNSTQVVWSSSVGQGGTLTITGSGTVSVLLLVPFRLGQDGSFTVTATAHGGCSLSGSGSCDSEVNFYDTAAITGFNLTDASGNPIDGTVTFGSGTDYNNIPSDVTTPEPSSYILFSTGFCLAFLYRLRRKAHP